MIATMGVMLVLHFSSLLIVFPNEAWGMVGVGIVVELWIRFLSKA